MSLEEIQDKIEEIATAASEADTLCQRERKRGDTWARLGEWLKENDVQLNHDDRHMCTLYDGNSGGIVGAAHNDNLEVAVRVALDEAGEL